MRSSSIMRRHRTIRTFLVALLHLPLVLVAQRANAQFVWESANRGVEGAYVQTFQETPTGGILAGTSAGIFRHDGDGWTRTAGPGNVWRFAVDARGAIYAMVSYDLYRSTDDGRTWAAVTVPGLRAMVEGRDGRVILFSGDGRSLDGGSTWESGSTFWPWFITDGGQGRLFAAYEDTLFSSTDTGRSWQVATTVGNDITGLVAVDDTTLLAGSERAILRSTDAGSTWTPSSALPAAEIVATPAGTILVRSLVWERGSPDDALLRSTDGGRTFASVLDGPIWAATETSSGALWASRSPDVMTSTDAGASWRIDADGLTGRGGTVFESENIFYALVGGVAMNIENGYPVLELARSDDEGVTWKPLIDTLRDAQLLPGSTGIVATQVHQRMGDPSRILEYELLFSSDRGESWGTIGNAALLAASANESGTIAVTSHHGTDSLQEDLVLSTDRGATWTARTTPGVPATLAVLPSRGIILGAAWTGSGGSGGGGVYRSDDLGATWRLLLASENAHRIYAMGEDRITLVARHDTSSTYRILSSSDAGATWRTNPLTGEFAAAVADSDGALVVLSVDRDRNRPYLAQSIDSGLTWRTIPLDEGLNGLSMLTATRRGEIFGIVEGALARSIDHGSTWQLVDDGIEHSWRSIAASDRTVVGSTFDEGLWRSARFTSSVAMPSLARATCALAIHPTPATDRVTVAVSPGTLELVDALGTRLASWRIAQGGIERTIDLTDLASGIYFVRLVTDETVRVGRVVVR